MLCLQHYFAPVAVRFGGYVLRRFQAEQTPRRNQNRRDGQGTDAGAAVCDFMDLFTAGLLSGRGTWGHVLGFGCLLFHYRFARQLL